MLPDVLRLLSLAEETLRSINHISRVRSMKRISLAAILLIPLLLVAACSGEQYGAGVDPAALSVTVKDVFLKPELLGKEVTIEGKVFTQCESNGCWFVLQDDTGQIYVDLSRNNFALPSKHGRKVKASGTVTTFQNNLLLVARGVEVK
jgi:uncharacterized protein YdeI (BOF family)